MNNSKIVIDDLSLSFEEEVPVQMKEREATLVRIIEAISRVKVSAEWSTLKSLIFDSTVEHLEKRLKHEAEQMELNTSQIHHLQGQLQWARKYADLTKLEDTYRIELSNIRRLTQPTER